jgi:hypothetical protein
MALLQSWRLRQEISRKIFEKNSEFSKESVVFMPRLSVVLPVHYSSTGTGTGCAVGTGTKRS